MQKYDFVVIGSGPCGMLSAYFVKKGKTLIVEEGPEINDREKIFIQFLKYHQAM